MKLPTDKSSLSVFLRDYGERSRKTRGQKIEIMKNILANKTVLLDGIEHELNEGEYRTMRQLYYKYVLGKWASEIMKEDILDAFKNEDAKEGKTIRDLAKSFKCTEEVIRTKIESLMFDGALIRSTNPENRRQGLYFLKSRYVSEGTKEAVA